MVLAVHIALAVALETVSATCAASQAMQCFPNPRNMSPIFPLQSCGRASIRACNFLTALQIASAVAASTTDIEVLSSSSLLLP